MIKVNPLLAKIFVCISFAWDVSKLGYLEQSVATVLGYPTNVDVCVLTDHPDKLENVFLAWEMRGLRVCEESGAADDDPNQYALLWRHRAVLARAATGEAPYAVMPTPILHKLLVARFALRWELQVQPTELTWHSQALFAGCACCSHSFAVASAFPRL